MGRLPVRSLVVALDASIFRILWNRDSGPMHLSTKATSFWDTETSGCLMSDRALAKMGLVPAIPTHTMTD